MGENNFVCLVFKDIIVRIKCDNILKNIFCKSIFKIVW